MFRVMLPPAISGVSRCARPGIRQPVKRAYAEVRCAFVPSHAPGVSRLTITDLQVRFGERRVVDLAELAIAESEIVGLAGESGSGKSMTTLAVLGLAHTVGARVDGSVRLDGAELTGLSQREMRAV